MTYKETWDLDAIFAGGSSSQELAAFTKKMNDDLDRLRKRIDSLSPKPGDDWKSFILDVQDLNARFFQASSFTECLEAQNTSDKEASQLTGRLDAFRATLKTIDVRLEDLFLRADDAGWNQLLQSKELAPIAFALNEQRALAKKKMDREKEILTTELAKDGYHAWGRLYDKIAGSLRADWKTDGKTEKISMGQLHNKMESPEAGVRKEAFEKLEGAWTSVADYTAAALNAQAGFRLTMYDKRKWDSVLFEPLQMNRLSRKALDTMWGVVADGSEKLLPYLDEKARLLGRKKLTWYDKSAPVASKERALDYNEAAPYIVDQFARFSGDMADFAKMAFEKRWIEVEDRAGKGAGGFCTDFPVSEETRIFMTYGGTFGGVSTLAHELGHSYHTWLLRKKPYYATMYPMTLAETASTFCESLILDAALDAATDEEERLTLLDKKLDEAATMMMNLRSRFVFEMNFFKERANGPLSVDKLNTLMVDAQKEAYCNGLDDDAYHPYFWASKLHFYITTYPFYNFPYVFGYLFSIGLYDRALNEGPSFAAKYDALLEDTGIMTCEDLAKKHLGIDLTKPDFWEASVGRATGHVEDFVKLAQQKTGAAR
ncbi:MAG: M3 family oligoendopeptidase [Gemmatimonadetes bacterium]|nr:M3 family oligoendopeptidase [Gemmatimonadota bacterium]